MMKSGDIEQEWECAQPWTSIRYLSDSRSGPGVAGIYRHGESGASW